MVSLNDVNPGSSADSSCIQQVVDAWKGTVGKGVPLSVTAVNDSVNFSGDFMNLDTNNSRALRVRNSSGTVLFQADVNGVVLSSTGEAATTALTAAGTATLTNKTENLLSGSSNTMRVPQCRVFNTSSQTISNNTLTPLTFNSERWNNDSLHSTSVNTSRITPSRAGLYDIGGNAALDGNSSGLFRLTVWLNSTTAVAQTQVVNVAAIPLVLNIATQYQLSTSDFVELAVTQTSGGNLGTQVSANAYPEFWAHFAGSS